MTDLLMCYITCEDVAEAKKIGKMLLEKRLAGCVNIYPEMVSMFLWPPKSGKIDESSEVVLIAKTVERKYEELEKAVKTLHSYDTVCVIAMPAVHVSQEYYDWIVGEME